MRHFIRGALAVLIKDFLDHNLCPIRNSAIKDLNELWDIYP